MALVTCAECGNEISTQARACPKCGAPVPRKSFGFGTLLLILLLGGVLIALLSPSDRKPEVPLNATVNHFSGHFAIRNNDSFGWQHCDLDLNSDYSVKEVSIAAGETYRVAASQFAKTDGTRFNVVTTKPQSLYVYCRDTPAGTRSTLVGWK